MKHQCGIQAKIKHFYLAEPERSHHVRISKANNKEGNENKLMWKTAGRKMPALE